MKKVIRRKKLIKWTFKKTLKIRHQIPSALAFFFFFILCHWRVDFFFSFSFFPWFFVFVTDVMVFNFFFLLFFCLNVPSFLFFFLFSLTFSRCVAAFFSFFLLSYVYFLINFENILLCFFFIYFNYYLSIHKFCFLIQYIIIIF